MPVRHLDDHRVALRRRDRGTAGSPRAETEIGATADETDGHAYLILDGTLISIDRVAADRPYYSGNTATTG